MLKRYDRPVRSNEYDGENLLCVCGNHSHDQDFGDCDDEGRLVDDYTGLYLCAKCCAVLDADSYVIGVADCPPEWFDYSGKIALQQAKL